MIYILGLFIILALIFSSMSGSNIAGNFLSQIKDSINAVIFPKTEREILIDNLSSNYQYLDKFFSESAPKILSSKNVAEDEKIDVRKAVETFNNSKNLISNLSKLEKEEKGPLKTIGSLVEKVLNINNNQSQTSPNSTTLSNPTSIPTPISIPPQCQLVCPSK